MTCPTCKAEVVVERVEEDCRYCDGFGRDCDMCDGEGIRETTEFFCNCEDDE